MADPLGRFPLVGEPRGMPGDVTATAVFSPRDVWAFGCPGISDGVGAMHFDGHSWHRIGVPGSGFELSRAAPDGHGGFWAVTSPVNPALTRMLHYSHGRWTRVTLPTLNGEALMPFDLTQVPGTASAWATAGHLSKVGSVVLRFQPSSK